MLTRADIERCQRGEHARLAELDRSYHRLVTASRRPRPARVLPHGRPRGRTPSVRRTARQPQDPDPHIGSAPPAAVDDPSAAPEDHEPHRYS